MIKHVLREHGIKAFVQGEHMQQSLGQTIDVWIEKQEDENQARTIINDLKGVQSDQRILKRSQKKGLTDKGFSKGLIIGFLIALIGLMIYQKFQTSSDVPSSWDSNGDGRMDVWSEYSNNLILKQSYDVNFDGTQDTWEYFDPPGEISRAEHDQNFDGEVDYWIYYQNGIAQEYKADNDRDGRVDEWGIMEYNTPKKRYWSFNNDEIADKKTEYKNGLKISEMYDRNRDGTFDEIIMLDEFERIIID
jgi:antitoxin component YwqK of YwqJK toxin-antitoxin module